VGERILIACSGGADSVALVHLLFSLRPQWRFELIIAHCNHALRGEESEQDEAFVRQLAQEWNLPIHCERLDWQKKGFSEEWARRLRYDFLRRTAQAQQARWVALGHTGDDVAETILLNLLRGSGSGGLKGIPHLREGLFIRPLLNTSRAEILSYLQKQQIAFREDSSNADTKYLRNKIRHELLPLLEREYNPRIRFRLRRTAAILTHEDEYLDQQAQYFLDEQQRRITNNNTIITTMPTATLNTLPMALRARILGKALQDSFPGEGGVYSEHIQALLRLSARVNGSKEVHLPHGIRASREYGYLFIKREEGKIREKAEKAKREKREVTHKIVPPTTVLVAGLRMHFELVPASEAYFTSSDVVFLDNGSITPPLLLRRWRAGDTIKPLGMNGKKRKLQDIFTDKKIPLEQRAHLPVLVDAKEILWIPHLVVSESVRISPQSRVALKIAIKDARPT